MRRWLLLLVVLLLPLRGWMGDAMAGQMHHAPLGAHVQAVASDAEHGCGDHGLVPPALHAQDAQAQELAQADPDAPTCASCQVCSAVALSPARATAPPSAFSHPRPQTVQLAYASADSRLFLKPPRH